MTNQSNSTQDTDALIELADKLEAKALRAVSEAAESTLFARTFNPHLEIAERAFRIVDRLRDKAKAQQ